MIRLYAFELEFTIKGERYTRTMVASSDDNARRDLCNCYPVDVAANRLIARRKRQTVDDLF